MFFGNVNHRRNIAINLIMHLIYFNKSGYFHITIWFNLIQEQLGITTSDFPHVTVSAYLCLRKPHILSRTHTPNGVILSAGAANTSREHLRSNRKPNPLHWETVTMDTPAYGWAKAFQWGQIMIDASSCLLYSSLCCFPNSPERFCHCQITK